jgi:hypothetical protein
MELIVVVTLALWALTSVVFAIYMARTTWHAQNRQADMERTLASAQFAKQPETLPLAADFAPQVHSDPQRTYERMMRVPLERRDLEEINQEP